MNSSRPAADPGAASAAPTRHPVPEADFDRILVVDDRNEDATQILTVITERTCFANRTTQEVQS
jgi:hypothetical protein